MRIGYRYRAIDFLHTDDYIFDGSLCYVCADNLCDSLCAGGDSGDAGGVAQKKEKTSMDEFPIWYVIIKDFTPYMLILISTYLGYRFGIGKEIRLQKHEQKQKIYGKLMGLQNTCMMTYISLFETDVERFYNSLH